jgi:hypothetical protein
MLSVACDTNIYANALLQMSQLALLVDRGAGKRTVAIFGAGGSINHSLPPKAKRIAPTPTTNVTSSR